MGLGTPVFLKVSVLLIRYRSRKYFPLASLLLLMAHLHKWVCVVVNVTLIITASDQMGEEACRSLTKDCYPY